MSFSDKKENQSEPSLSRRNFLQTAGMASIALGAMAMAPSESAAKSSPIRKNKPAGKMKAKPYNVLLILTDQERYMPDLIGKGHWPARDKLTKMGTTFENHQVCSMVCTPSRSVIFTGQHIQHTKMFDNTDFPWISDMSYDIPTVGHMMRDAGYYTAYQGKWHLNRELHEPVDTEKGYKLIGHDIMDKYGFSDFTGIGDEIGMTRGGYDYDQFVTATAQTWLRTKGKKLSAEDAPWFLTVGLVNPHDVMFYDTDGPGEDVQSSTKLSCDIEPAPDDRVYKKEWNVPLSPSRKQPWDEPGRPNAHYEYQKSQTYLTGHFPNEDKRWKKLQDYYLNCISDNDRSVDILLTELENLGMLDDTIVIFTSDHGELCGGHGMSGKGATAYQEQDNVPFIVYHPDIKGGKKCKSITSHLDLIPTILGMTGSDKKLEKKITDPLKGNDFSPLLEQPEKASMNAVRNGTLYCYNMWAFMDADWMGKVAAELAAGTKLTFENMPRPDTKKRSAIRSVFDGQYKFSRYFNPQEHNTPKTIAEIYEVNDVELYDLKSDPHELKNLAYDSENSELLLTMNKKMNELIAHEVGADDGSFLPNIEGVNWTFDRFVL
ncbi:sulfatase-like hydrolase/transferase [Maridesulfovibrio frigidus]|uniref:sulfatase-like hydrolase/transferase n=1 Tax=Maridesulfovibrio frigidus TaxID=340956 RepID=UPI0004E157E8|nr:sulfatase-like hydrolase/transferase [Maridesulfovibrio frigidus]